MKDTLEPLIAECCALAIPPWELPQDAPARALITRSVMPEHDTCERARGHAGA